MTRPLFALSLSVVLLGACRDSLPVQTTPVPDFTEHETRQIVSVLSLVSSVDLSFLIEEIAAAGPSGAATTDFFVDTVPCPVGGTVIVSGVMEWSDGDGEVTIDLRDEFRDCVVETQGGHWMFSGSPGLRSLLTLTIDDDSGDLVFAGRLSGAVDVVGPGLVGPCAIDVDLADGEESPLATGTLCGHPLERLREPPD